MWTTSTADLRTLLSDGSSDKLRYRKKILGRVDATNTTFKTFEKRRLTNFLTDVDTTLGIFINGVRTPNVGITADNPAVGEVVLVAAPAVNDYVEATYYVQWFLDSELVFFLSQAATWLGFIDPTGIPPGLQPAATYYGAQEAYHKLALRWSETISEEFRLEDAPSDRVKTPVEMYRQLAEDARKKSIQLRDQFYSGQGQEKQATSVSLAGAVSKVVPQR